MPRFTDDWVVDRVESLISEMSDIETDAAQTEVQAYHKSPWPLEMRNQIWADRVKLRVLLKKSIPKYQEFWNLNGRDFSEWMKTRVSAKQLKKMLQVPRSELSEILKTTYNIHSAFGGVLCAVMEQVANFSATGYGVDGIGSCEVQFEQALAFDRRGGFTLSNIVNAADKSSVNTEILAVLVNRIESLGGPKLLDRRVSSRVKDEEDEGGADEPCEQTEANPAKPSFRSDRRIVRLLVARYWADALREKFLRYKQEEQENAAEVEVEKDVTK